MSILIYEWKNMNLPKWVSFARIRQFDDRSTLEIMTIHQNRMDVVCFDTLQNAKGYYSREYGTPGFRAKWEIQNVQK